MNKVSVKSLYVLFVCLFMSISYGYAQNCASELEVVKNRSYKAISSKSGAAFFELALTNKSSSESVFTILKTNANIDCSNKHFPSKGANAQMNIQLMDNYARTISDNKITIGAGQTVNFKVKVTAAQSASVDSWGCIEIQALNNRCNSVSSSTILRTYLPNPADSE